MREILFRGKRVDSGEWVCGWYCKYPFIGWTFKDCIIPAGKAEDGCIEHVEVDPDTVGQDTGLTDIMGAKIIEGDILLFQFEQIEDQKAIVEWSEKYAAFILRPLDDFLYAGIQDGEVIGNIHDNPEMMEG